MEIEEDLDAAYQGYLQRQGVRAEAARQKRKRLGMEGEMGSDEEADPSKPEYEPGSDAEEPQEVRHLSCCWLLLLLLLLLSLSAFLSYCPLLAAAAALFLILCMVS